MNMPQDEEASSTEADAISPSDPPEGETSAAERLEEARHYGRISLHCDLADRLIDLLFLTAAAFLFGKALDGWLAEQFGWLETQSTARLLALGAALYLLHAMVSFPLSFYSGYLVEKRFDLSTLSPWGWFQRWAKRNALGLVFVLLINWGLFFIIWNVGRGWWIVAAIIFFAASFVLGQLMPVVILPLFYKITRLDAPELTERFEKLTSGTGLAIEGTYRMELSAETSKANAMLAGLGRTRRVLLGDTLLDHFSNDEIEVIFAHEVGHHVFRHIPKLLVAGAGYSLLGLWLCDRVLIAQPAITSYAEVPTAALPLLTLALTLFGMVLEPLQNMMSRKFERQCDRYALERTGNATAYRSAFGKLAEQNKADPDPNPVEVFLFHSHPPIQERIAMANE